MENAIQDLRVIELDTRMRNAERKMQSMSIQPNSNYFSSNYEKYEADMLLDVYNAIEKEGLLDWFKNYEPEDDKGFMFSSCKELTRINSAMKLSHLHSGSSYGWMMRVVHSYVKRV